MQFSAHRITVRSFGKPLVRGGLSGLFSFCLLMLMACGGQRDRLNIECEFQNIDQADFLLFSMDGGLSTIDTLHLRKGKAEHNIELHDTATFTIVYPNFQQLTFRAAPGDEVRIKGDALSLREVKVEGCTPMQEVSAPMPKQIAIGQKAPTFKVTDMDRREHQLRDYKGKYLLLSFWANWRGASSVVITGTKQALRNHEEEIEALTISLDCDSVMVESGRRRDDISWPVVFDAHGWYTPMVQKFCVDNVPYCFLIDPKGKVIAKGINFDRDIKPEIDKI